MSGPYREAPVRHAHTVSVTKDEIIEALNLLRAKRELPLAPPDDTIVSGRAGKFPAGEYGAAVIVDVTWETIE